MAILNSSIDTCHCFWVLELIFCVWCIITLRASLVSYIFLPHCLLWICSAGVGTCFVYESFSHTLLDICLILGITTRLLQHLGFCQSLPRSTSGPVVVAGRAVGMLSLEAELLGSTSPHPIAVVQALFLVARKAEDC